MELPEHNAPSDVKGIDIADRRSGAKRATTKDASKVRSNLLDVEIRFPLDAADRLTPFIFDPIIPAEKVTLLSGHGGVGKSMFALTLAAHLACGKAFCGMQPKMGRAVYVSLEDDASTVLRRLERIVNEFELDATSVKRNLCLKDGSESGEPLAETTQIAGRTTLRFTKSMDEVEASLQGAELLIIDHAALAFDGDENIRRQVSFFMRKLASLAKFNKCAILLLAHVDKSAIRQGARRNSYSGSTAWHNASRSRITLLSNSNGVLLAHEKLNDGRMISPISLYWCSGGVLRAATSTSESGPNQQSEEHDKIDAMDDERVLEAIQRVIQKTGRISDASTGPNNTLQVLSADSLLMQHLSGRRSKRRIRAALLRLEQDGRITHEEYTDGHRKSRSKWVVRAEQSSKT